MQVGSGGLTAIGERVVLGAPPDRKSAHQQGREPSMLVLFRQRDETIMIGDGVEIAVVGYFGRSDRSRGLRNAIVSNEASM